MEKRELTCIGCPLGCAITVTLEGKDVKDIVGFTCKRGKEYARKEVTNPTRIVTSTVRLVGSKAGERVVSCKTAQDIPKGKIFAVVAVGVFIVGIVLSIIILFLIYAVGHLISQNNEIIRRL